MASGTAAACQAGLAAVSGCRLSFTASTDNATIVIEIFHQIALTARELFEQVLCVLEILVLNSAAVAEVSASQALNKNDAEQPIVLSPRAQQ